MVRQCSVIGLFLALVPATAHAQGSTTLPRLTPASVYEHCMPPEIKIAIEEKKDDPQLVAHFICTYYARICNEKPESESCQKALRRYGEAKADTRRY